MIQAENISLTINGVDVLKDITLNIPTGESVAFVGSSGSGKTSLLNVISLVVTATAGQLTIDGKNSTRVRDTTKQRFWRDNAAFVLQDYGLIDNETAGYNVMLSQPPFRKKKAFKHPQVLKALDDVGLHERAASMVATLSGGQKQRVGIARALFKDANYVFADEPTASLDAENSERVARLLLKSGNPNRTVIIATHDLELARYCDRQIELRQGEVHSDSCS